MIRSLPHRQLRNKTEEKQAVKAGSLPHRQLRKLLLSDEELDT